MNGVINIFGLKLVSRLVLFAVSAVVLGRVLGDPNWVFAQLTLTGILILLTVDLYRLVHQTNSALNIFIKAWEFDEYGSLLKGRMRGARFKRLQENLQELKETKRMDYQQSETSRAIAEQLLNELKYGFMLLNGTGDILAVNTAAMESLNLPYEIGEANIKRLFPALSEQLDMNGSGTIHVDNIAGNKGLSLDKETIFIYSKPYHFIRIRSVDETDYDGDDWYAYLKVYTHEFLNGITPLYTTTQNLEGYAGQHDVDPKLQRNIDLLKIQSENLIELSNRYKNITRISAPQARQFSIKALLTELSEEYKDLQFEITAGSESELFADRGQIAQTLRNLIVNSEEAGSEKISIELFQKNLEFVLIYADNGAGIPESNYSSVFKPFFSTKSEGTGMGLMLSKQLLKLNRGSIRILKSDKGASFEIRLPALR